MVKCAFYEDGICTSDNSQCKYNGAAYRCANSMTADQQNIISVLSQKFIQPVLCKDCKFCGTVSCPMFLCDEDGLLIIDNHEDYGYCYKGISKN